MTDKQSEALQLADCLDRMSLSTQWDKKAAAELRRLHQANAELVELALEEREACAKLCEESDKYRGEYFAKLIRSRGQE